MQESVKELTPVEYNEAGVRLLNYSITAGRRCFRLHWHERMELIKLNSGIMEIDVGEEKIILAPNEVYIIPPKIPHTAIAKTDVQYDVIMFDVRSFYNDMPLSAKRLEPVFNGNARFDIKTSSPEIIRCCNALIAMDKEDGLLTISLVYSLIHLLYKNCLLEFCANAKADTVIMHAVKYIEENYADQITTKSLAKKFGYSSEHFCRKFKAETWLTPMKYLKTYRLEAAAKLLKEEKHTIAEIAMHCGFDDANYFTRCFKAHFGVPPTKF